MIKYIKSVLWRVAKRLSYTEEARCLKVNGRKVSEKYESQAQIPGTSAVRTLQADTVTVMHVMYACYQVSAAEQRRTALSVLLRNE